MTTIADKVTSIKEKELLSISVIEPFSASEQLLVQSPSSIGTIVERVDGLSLF
jgi:hypothetical protein